MATQLDHLTVVAPSLEAGSRFVRDALGIEPGPGRTHPGMGTHNRLLRLGDTVYLEVIAPDPDAPPPSRPRWFGLDHVAAPPRLATWVASTDDIVGAAVPELGLVETMRREHHVWQMTLTPDGQLPLAGAAPALIQRAPGVHPASALPGVGLRLRRLRIHHPEPDRVRALLARIRLASNPEVVVLHGSTCTLVAEIETPSGLKELVKPDSPVPARCLPFWQAFAATQPVDPAPRFLEAFFFDETQAVADELAALVLAGRKRATASLLWTYESNGKPIPQPGDLSIVTNFTGDPLCVIETRRVDIVAFEDVTKEFAAVEGEGDGSLAYWRRVHDDYFGRVCRQLGREPHPRMPVICERFEAVYV